ncbi:MAG: IclR family transcriptional regulator [Actinobacteria bacterium]|nr:IclR family transcriptional regulator [Actinomycetota bacterium]
MESARLKRIFEVLEQVADRGPQSLSQISNRAGIPTSSTHDLLKAMARAGILQVSGKDYDLGPITYRLAFDVQDRFSIINVATPELERLAQLVGFDVYLAVQSGSHVMYAARFRGNEEIKVVIPLGQTLYRHSTAAGKIFVAFDPELRKLVLSSPRKRVTPRTITDAKALERELNRIKSRRISISNEESFEGIIGIATPIAGSDGRIVAAAHISAFKGSLDSARMKKVCSELGKATLRIEESLATGFNFNKSMKGETRNNRKIVMPSNGRNS